MVGADIPHSVAQLERTNQRQAGRYRKQKFGTWQSQPWTMEPPAHFRIGPEQANRMIRCDEARRRGGSAEKDPPSLEDERQNLLANLTLALGLCNTVCLDALCARLEDGFRPVLIHHCVSRPLP